MRLDYFRPCLRVVFHVDDVVVTGKLNTDEIKDEANDKPPDATLAEAAAAFPIVVEKPFGIRIRVLSRW